MDPSNLLISYELDEEYSIPPTSGLAYLMELPVELLIEISQQCRYSDIKSLLRVNKRLYAVSIDRLYSTVVLHLNHLFFDPWGSSDDLVIEEAITRIYGCCDGVVRGLFARQEHMHALKSLVIRSMPGYPQVRGQVITKLAHTILCRAKNIQTIRIDGNLWNGYTTANEFLLGTTNLPSALKALHLHTLFEGAFGLLVNCHALTTLRIAYITEATFLDQIPEQIGKQIVDFDCTWEFFPGNDDYKAFSNRFAELLPNIQILEVTYVFTDEERNIQQTTMISEIMDAYLILFRNLKHLEELEFTIFETWPQHAEDIKAEDEGLFYARTFGEASETLRYITFPKEYGTRWKRGTATIQSKQRFQQPILESSVVESENQDIERLENLWTPDPKHSLQWWCWLQQFGSLLEMRRMMVKCWGKERRIPSLEHLTSWHSKCLQLQEIFDQIPGNI